MSSSSHAPIHCPGCEAILEIPDIGADVPPGTEVACPCGDAIGVLYHKRDGPTLIWWRPSRRAFVRVFLSDDDDAG